jgi:hypothetical protein
MANKEARDARRLLGAIDARKRLPPFVEANPAEGTGASMLAASLPILANGKSERRETHRVSSGAFTGR